MRPLAKVGEQETCKVSVHALVTTDKFIGESETRHETSLLEPEDGRKASREEDALNSSKSDQPFGERSPAIRNPGQSPLGFLLDTGDCLNSIE